MKSKLITIGVLCLAVAGIWLVTGGFLWWKPVEVSDTAFLMDTVVTIKIYTRNRSDGERLIADAFDEGRRVERIMEPLKGDGELQRINNGDSAGWHVISPELRMVLEDAAKVNRLSDGAFDPTIAAVKWLWTFEEGSTVPDSSLIAGKMAGVGFSHVRFSGDSLFIDNPATKIDLGGIAKGYAVDRMLAALDVDGVSGGLVNAGGDIAMFGEKPGDKDWVIAIQHPRLNRNLILEHVPLSAVVTSGDYERYFMVDGVRYHHILDPKTGYPARGSIAVTVWANDATDADALSTAIFVLGPEKGVALAERLEDVEALVFSETGNDVHASMSSGIKGKIAL